MSLTPPPKKISLFQHTKIADKNPHDGLQIQPHES